MRDLLQDRFFGLSLLDLFGLSPRWPSWVRCDPEPGCGSCCKDLHDAPLFPPPSPPKSHRFVVVLALQGGTCSNPLFGANFQTNRDGFSGKPFDFMAPQRSLTSPPCDFGPPKSHGCLFFPSWKLGRPRAAPGPIVWVDEIRSQHFEAMVEATDCWCLQGNRLGNQGL